MYKKLSSPILTQCNNQYPIMISNTSIAGRGGFATKDIIVGETIEVCPCLTTDDQSFKGDIRDYIFSTQDPNKACVAFGYCSIINHSDNPNAMWQYNESLDSLVVVAIKPIKKGEEILHSYGQGYWNARKDRLNKV